MSKTDGPGDMNVMLEDERILELMLQALDDDLDEQGSAELQRCLAASPAVAREWHSLLFVETLLRDTPAVPAPANFAARTLARLPNPRLRRTLLLAFYVALLIGGLLPLAGLLWFAGQLGGSATALGDLLGQLATFVQVVGSAVISTLGTVLREQPYAVGGLVLPLFLLAAWYSLYQQLTMQPVALGRAGR